MYLYPQASIVAVRGAVGSLLLAGAVVLVGFPQEAVGQERPDRREQQRIDEASRREAAVLVELVDKAADGEGGPAGLVLGWRNDFLKAQPGTFVPFILTVTAATPGDSVAGPALMYVRAARRETSWAAAASEGRRERPRYAFDAVFAVQLDAEPGDPAHVTRGFAVPAGEYDVFVAVRERPEKQAAATASDVRAGVMRQVLQVPDFWRGEFTTSTVMLARRIRKLGRSLSPEEALERPYAIGLNDVDVALDSTFWRDSELIVVFVIYDPAATEDGDFDVQVDYHVYKRGAARQDAPVEVPPARDGERYVTRTNPQRFNLRTLGPQPDSDSGYPVMAGQGILLSSFEAGEYRLGITVRDLLSGKTVTRDVTFRVEAGPGMETGPRSAQ
jgi:hypothetical protein